MVKATRMGLRMAERGTTLGRVLVWAGVLAAAVVVGVAFGAVPIHPTALFEGLATWLRGDNLDMQQTLAVGVRLPRVLLAVVVGGALAVAGAIYQALFGNPLADPYILGVSSGAGLGATIAFVLSSALGLGALRWGLVPAFAFLAGIVTIALVAKLGSRKGRLDPVSLLLAGVAISYTLAALTAFVMVLNNEQMSAIVYWNMGGLTRASWEYVLMTTPVAVVGATAAWYFARDLDLMLLGEVRAGHLGLDAKRFTKLALGLATLLTASAVAVSGSLGFVGLMVPHMVRIRYGSAHRGLIPLSFLGGGALVVLADLVARTILAPIEIPVGIVLAVLGGPFFVWLLVTQRGITRGARS